MYEKLQHEELVRLRDEGGYKFFCKKCGGSIEIYDDYYETINHLCHDFTDIWGMKFNVKHKKGYVNKVCSNCGWIGTVYSNKQICPECNIKALIKKGE